MITFVASIPADVASEGGLVRCSGPALRLHGSVAGIRECPNL